MIKCLFNLDGPPWTCTECNWIYARRGEPIMSEKPPRRNCPNAPEINTPEYRDRFREGLLLKLRLLVDAGKATATLAQIEARLDQCLNECDRFNGRVCIARGSDCKRGPRWQEHLLFHAEMACSFFCQRSD